MRKIKNPLLIFFLWLIPFQMFAWPGMPTSLLHADGRYLKDTAGNIIPTGIRNVTTTSSPFEIYPNLSSNGNFTISFSGLGSADLQLCIYNLEGKKVYEQNNLSSGGLLNYKALIITYIFFNYFIN